MLSHPVHVPAFLVVEHLQEEPVSPYSEKPIYAQNVPLSMALFPQKQPLRFHESSELDTETGTLALSHPAYMLAFWAVGRLQEEPASP